MRHDEQRKPVAAVIVHQVGHRALVVEAVPQPDEAAARGPGPDAGTVTGHPRSRSHWRPRSAGSASGGHRRDQPALEVVEGQLRREHAAGGRARHRHRRPAAVPQQADAGTNRAPAPARDRRLRRRTGMNGTTTGLDDQGRHPVPQRGGGRSAEARRPLRGWPDARRAGRGSASAVRDTGARARPPHRATGDSRVPSACAPNSGRSAHKSDMVSLSRSVLGARAGRASLTTVSPARRLARSERQSVIQ